MRNIKRQVVKPFSGRKVGDEVTLNHVEVKALDAIGFTKNGEYMTRDMSATTSNVLIADGVAQYAKENGIDITKVKGTGSKGRVTRADIEAAINDKPE